MSEKALGPKKEDFENQKPKDCWKQIGKHCKSFGGWLLSKAKLRLGLAFAVSLLLVMLLSRPLFYVVLAKSVALTVRVSLRRTMGLVAAVLDAILDEAATHLENNLNPTPMVTYQTAQSASGPTPQQFQQFQVQPMNSFVAYLLHGMCTLLGVIIGHRLPRAPILARTPPAHLRVA